VNVIDESANYLDIWMNFLKKMQKIIQKLIFDYFSKIKKMVSIFYKIEKYKHRYPICWRCKTELVFGAQC
jgi:isoleucyl-tRNA synthetase